MIKITRFAWNFTTIRIFFQRPIVIRFIRFILDRCQYRIVYVSINYRNRLVQSSHKVHYSVSLFGTKLASRQIDNQSSYICIKSRLTLGLVFFPSVDREDAISSKFTLERTRSRHKGEFIVDHRTQIFVEMRNIGRPMFLCREKEREKERGREREKERERNLTPRV